jgi:lipopolysaccharide biosynthesis glycosyltransferase
MKNETEIFFASDTNYLPYLSCALVSLSDRSSPDKKYNVHILTTDFSEESLAETKKLVGENITIDVHDLSERIAEIKRELSVRLRDYYSDSIYYRIFIPNMFPRLTKAVYLDADIVLNDDVANLFNTKLSDNLVGAVTDESVVGVPIFCDYVKRQIGIDDEREYFNSGVLVMNLSAMREEKLEEKFIHLLKTYNFDTVAPDQDYLNLLCRGRVLYLEGGWNKHPIAENVLPESELHLMHYNMFNKPWHYQGVQNEKLFWEAAKRTPFARELAAAKRGYTEKQRDNDLECAKRLLLSAKRIAEGSVFMQDAVCKKKKRITNS